MPKSKRDPWRRRPFRLRPVVDTTTITTAEALAETGWSEDDLERLIEQRRVYRFPREPGGELVHLRSNVLEVHQKVRREELERPRRGCPVKYCYFIGADDGPVKIGHSANPKARLRSIQTNFPTKLKILAVVVGGPDIEKAYHDRFSSFRLEGEWFERTENIDREIDRIRGEVHMDLHSDNHP